eukprot:2281153-Pleurochrysis_carterae.AAC.1
MPLGDPSAALIVVERLATAFLSATHATRRPSAVLPALERQLTDRKALVEQCIRDARSSERVVDALLLETQTTTNAAGSSNLGRDSTTG